jgi:hypothetical protein
LRWFLGKGVDVNAHGCLHWAIDRGRSAPTLRLLIGAGADIDLPHPDVGMRPLAAAAVRAPRGLRPAHRPRGDGELDPVSEAMLAVARGASVAPPEAPPPMPGIAGTDSRWVLGQLALLGRTEVVRALLDAGVPVDSRGWSNFTPLEQAAMHGRIDTVRLLIERGADLQDCAFDDEEPTPLDAAVWAWRNNRVGDGDYDATVALLIAAGPPTRHTPPTGNARIDTLLKEQIRGPKSQPGQPPLPGKDPSVGRR